MIILDKTIVKELLRKEKIKAHNLAQDKSSFNVFKGELEDLLEDRDFFNSELSKMKNDFIQTLKQTNEDIIDISFDEYRNKVEKKLNNIVCQNKNNFETIATGNLNFGFNTNKQGNVLQSINLGKINFFLRDTIGNQDNVLSVFSFIEDSLVMYEYKQKTVKYLDLLKRNGDSHIFNELTKNNDNYTLFNDIDTTHFIDIQKILKMMKSLSRNLPKKIEDFEYAEKLSEYKIKNFEEFKHCVKEINTMFELERDVKINLPEKEYKH